MRWFNNLLHSGSGSGGNVHPTASNSHRNPTASSTSSGGSYAANTTMALSDDFSYLSLSELEPETAMEAGEDFALDDRNLAVAYNCARHIEDIIGADAETQSWRMRERMKTVSLKEIGKSISRVSSWPPLQGL